MIFAKAFTLTRALNLHRKRFLEKRYNKIRHADLVFSKGVIV